MVIALRLASAGYCGGDPERVLDMRVDLAIAALQFEAFKTDYEAAAFEMNKESDA